MDTWEPDEATKKRILRAWDDITKDEALLRSCAQALEFAQRRPLKLETTRGKISGYVHFVSFAGWLAVVESPQTFPLPSKTLAALFGYDDVRPIYLMIDWAIEDGLLQEVEGSKLFTFAISKFEELQERV